MPAVRTYIGLGANVGDSRRTLAAAVHALGALPRARVAGVSRLYVTTPVGVRDQPEFHNAVVALDVPAGPGGNTGPIALLLALKSIERAFGRRQRYRHGPRELDLDLLVFGDEQVIVERPPEGRSIDPARAEATRFLEVPHPQARCRLFVLAPLADLAPDLVPPGWDETVAQARARQEAEEGEAAARPIAHWDAELGSWADEESEAGEPT